MGRIVMNEKIPDTPLSREKLLEYLKSCKKPTGDIDTNHRFIYIIGRNALAYDIILAIYFGEFDMDKEEK